MTLNNSKIAKRKIPIRNARPSSFLREMSFRTKEKRMAMRDQLKDRRKLETIQACFSFIASTDKISLSLTKEYAAQYLAEEKLKFSIESGFFISKVTKDIVANHIVGAYAASFSKLSTRQKLLEALFSLALHKGELSQENEINLDYLSKLLRFTPQKYASIKRRSILRSQVKSQLNNKKNMPDGESLGELASCYAALGCNPHDTDAILKQKYRSLVKELHPDRYAAKNLSEAQIAKKVKSFQKIQAAYEAIKAMRQPVKPA